MIAAILRAQLAAMRNSRLGAISRGGVWTLLTNLLWYGFWIGLAFLAYTFTADPATAAFVDQALPRGLMILLVYWQIAPVLVASLGASLDLRKLRVFPIPEGQLFWIEVVLRLTTGIEMLLILTGSSLGLMRNPVSGGWHRVPEVLFPMAVLVSLNLLIAAGLRNLIDRLLSYKRLREVLVLLMVLLAAIPQLLIVTGMPTGRISQFFTSPALGIWPWTLAAFLVAPGRAFAASSWAAWAGLFAWVGIAYLFGRWQFEQSLRFDATAARAEGDRGAPIGFAEAFFRLPGRLLPDPIAAVAEKELRTLLRSARFRLVFIMGFTFGLIIWLPMVFSNNSGGFLATNFMALVCIYSLTLLGQVTYWNCLGFDRSASQLYFAAPMPISSTLAGKNVAAAALMLIEITVIAAICWAVRTPVTLAKTAEAYAVTIVVMIFLFAAGNLTSVNMPRAMNPERATQSSASGKGQALMFVVYPAAVVPALLAYLGRYAFRSDAAFYGILALFAAIGAVVYGIALESAVRTAEVRREEIVAELSRGAGPVTME